MMFVLTCDKQMFDNVSRETYRARVWQGVAWVARETIYIKDIEICEQTFCEIFRYSIFADNCYNYHSNKKVKRVPKKEPGAYRKTNCRESS